MSKAQGHQAGSLLKLKPPSNMMMRDFDLPDDMFFHLKQERMLRSHSHSSCIQCELVDGSGSMVGLKCTEVIPCLRGKVAIECVGGYYETLKRNISR